MSSLERRSELFMPDADEGDLVVQRERPARRAAAHERGQVGVEARVVILPPRGEWWVVPFGEREIELRLVQRGSARRCGAGSRAAGAGALGSSAWMVLGAAFVACANAWPGPTREASPSTRRADAADRMVSACRCAAVPSP